MIAPKNERDAAPGSEGELGEVGDAIDVCVMSRSLELLEDGGIDTAGAGYELVEGIEVF